MRLRNIAAALLLATSILSGMVMGPVAGANSGSGVLHRDASYETWHDAARGRDVPVRLYVPKDGQQPYPVVIFSHGLGGNRDAAEYLGKYWADHGYLGVFIQHAGSDANVWKPVAAQGPRAVMAALKPQATGKNLALRADDVHFAIDELTRRNQSDPILSGKADLTKIAIAGHSFGAGTALAVAGQNFGTRGNGTDPRIKAAIYLCPPVGAGSKLNPGRAYGSIKIPGMLLTGTEDNSPIGNTSAEDRRIPFDGISVPHQYLLNFIGANHMVFGGSSFRAPGPNDDRMHAYIDEVTRRFLDAYLKGDKQAQAFLDGSGMTSFIGSAAKIERH